MNKQCQALFESHSAFELKQWQGRTLNKRLKEEAAAFWDWAENISLAEFSSAEQITEIARRFTADMPLPEEIAEIIGTIAKHLVELPVNRNTSVSEVIPDELFDDGVELIVDLKHLREEAIRQSINSPVYATLVSEILYNGIRDYMTSENAITQKVPGMSKLIKKGGDALSKRIPNLEERLRGFIEKNMENTISQSEKFLQNALSDERIRHIAEEIWEMIHESHLSVAEVLNEDEVDAIVAYGFQFWLHLRETDYLQALIAEAIEKVFDEYGDTSLSVLLTNVGITKKLIQDETLTIGPQLVKVFEDSGYLEATIRRRLKPFYESKDVRAALN